VIDRFRPEALRDREPFAFSPVDETGPLRSVTREQVRAFNERGWFVLHDLLAPAEVDALREELDPLVEQEQERLRAVGGRQFISQADGIVFVPWLVTRSERALRLARDPRIAGVCTDLLGPDVRLYWDQAVYKYPSFDREFPWHQDNGYNFVDPEMYLTFWIALSRTTPENGAPEVVSGSHRLGTLVHEPGEDGFACKPPGPGETAELAAGSALVFASLTVHRTPPNRTRDQVRRAYLLQYARDGAAMYPRNGGRVPCDDPKRQFPVAVGGRPVGTGHADPGV
jgi:ectoine hydroxylase-related dioxygenase (phytanoyl-CoA dioxygenase family)